MTARAAIGLFLAAMLGAAITFAVITIADDSDQNRRVTRTTVVAEDSSSVDLVDRESAEELVVEAVEVATDDSTPYADAPEAACPDDVPLRRGETFLCEALVEGRLIPVGVEVISDLGFLEVIGVG